MNRETPRPPEECAQCGGDIPRRAHACPGCGADERTGWREASIYDGFDLPDEVFASERDGKITLSKSARMIGGLAWYWWVVGVILSLGFGFVVLGLLR